MAELFPAVREKIVLVKFHRALGPDRSMHVFSEQAVHEVRIAVPGRSIGKGSQRCH